jgi:hypothetical protein
VTPLLLPLALRLVGTVDRIEGDFAVVEWRNGELTDVGLALLPTAVQEGDRVVLRSRRVSSPASLITRSRPGATPTRSKK